MQLMKYFVPNMPHIIGNQSNLGIPNMCKEEQGRAKKENKQKPRTATLKNLLSVIVTAA